MTATNPRRNRARGAQDERDVAKVLGTERYWANSGGPEDCKPLDGMAIQVKGGKQVVTQDMREALASARMAAGEHGLPTVVLVDRRGTRIQRWIAFPLAEWAAWNGYPREAAP